MGSHVTCSPYYVVVNEELNVHGYPISVHVMPSNFRSHVNNCQKLLMPESARIFFLKKPFLAVRPIHFMDVAFRMRVLVFLRRTKDKVIEALYDGPAKVSQYSVGIFYSMNSYLNGRFPFYTVLFACQLKRKMAT